MIVKWHASEVRELHRNKKKKKSNQRRQRTWPWEFGLPCDVNSCMLSSLQQWDVTKPPSLVHHLPGSLQGEIPSDGSDSIRCRAPNIPPQTISLICSSLSHFPRVPLSVRKLLFCQAETARQIPCQNSFPSGLFHEEFDFQSVDCTDDSTHL